MGARVATAILILIALLAAGTCGFYILGGPEWSWMDALYMTVITITTVGFDVVHPLDTSLRILTAAVAVAGVGVFLYALSILVDGFVGRLLPDTLRLRRMEKRISKLRNHTVICGFGRVGRAVAAELAGEDARFCVVDRQQERVRQAADLGWQALCGDSTEEAVLERAGIDHATSLMACLGHDVDNLLLTMTARGQNPGCKVIARASDPRTEKKLLRAGASRVVTPMAIGGRRMAQSLLRPGVLAFADVAFGAVTRELALEEVVLGPAAPDEGGTLAGLDLAERYGVSVVGIRRSGGALEMAPRGSTAVHRGDRLWAWGPREGLERLASDFAPAS